MTLIQNIQSRHDTFRSFGGAGPLCDITNIARNVPVGLGHDGISKSSCAFAHLPVARKSERPAQQCHTRSLKKGVSCTDGQIEDPCPLGTEPSMDAATKCSSSSSASKVNQSQYGRAGGLFNAGTELVREYLVDFSLQLEEAEAQSIAKPEYMDRQKHVNPQMRKILVEWLADVNDSYRLRLETLCVAVNVLDRYLMLRIVTRRNYQLVGLTALLIAAKFGEQNPPTIQDLAAMADKTYSEDEIAMMEMKMLMALQFKIFQPNAWHFLAHYQCLVVCTEAVQTLSQRILASTLSDYNMLQYTPSTLGAATFLVALKLKQQPVPVSFYEATKKSEEALKACGKDVCDMLENANPNHWQQHIQRAKKRPRDENGSANALAASQNARPARAARTR